MNKSKLGLFIAFIATAISLDLQAQGTVKGQDSEGFGMSVTAIAIILVGLILMYIAFRIIGSIAVKMRKRNAMKAHGITDKKTAREQGFGARSGEEFAAIGMAMHEHFEDVHDIEDMIITINKVKRTYSPWSSKIYTLRETPRVNHYHH